MLLSSAPELRDINAPPEWQPLLRILSKPVDQIKLLDGEELEIEPLALPVRPGQATESLTVRVAGEQMPRELDAAIQAVVLFEDRFLALLAPRLAAMDLTRADLELAERLLVSALRSQRSLRCPPPLAANPWTSLQGRLEEKLVDVRRRLLRTLEKGAGAEALALSERWAVFYPAASPLQDEMRALWLRHAEALLQAGDFKQARVFAWRIERTFGAGPQVAELRRSLKTRAEKLADEARTRTGAEGLKPLQDALELWPWLPGARDEVERRRGTYQVLRVAVRTLPQSFSPATAATDVEEQVQTLLFEGLVQPRLHPTLGKTYRPALLEHLPAPTTQSSARLRSDLFWSDGTRLTSADIRHTLLLGRQHDHGWRECLEVPRFEGNPDHVELVYKHTTLDHLAPLTLPLLPQKYRGRALEAADDPKFAEQPVGSGPYQLVVRQEEGGPARVVFASNPYHVRAGRPEGSSIRELHLTAWNDRPAVLGQPLPHLVWDVPTALCGALRQQGYSDIRTLTNPRVHCLALNCRHKVLAAAPLRRALALAIDRHGLLERHFRATDTPAHQTANAPFRRGSWAEAAPPRVPAELYQPEHVAPQLKQLKETSLELTLKYPDDDARVAAALGELARQVEQRFAAGGVKLTLRLAPLSPALLRRSVEKGDYELAYHALAHGDEPARLAALFEGEAQAGGSNHLGYDDAKLQALLRSLLQQRAFAAVRDTMHAVHAHLVDTMPLIPLWQLDTHVAVHRALRLPPLDGLSMFADVLEWKLTD